MLQILDSEAAPDFYSATITPHNIAIRDIMRHVGIILSFSREHYNAIPFSFGIFHTFGGVSEVWTDTMSFLISPPPGLTR